MKHKYFRILSLVALFIIILLSGIYDYIVKKDYKLSSRLIVKISPNFCLMILSFSYMFIYRATLYSCGVLLSLLLCLIGDIFMGIYDPSLIDISKNKMIYILLGGSFFFLSRVLLSIVFSIKPYKRVSLIEYGWKKVVFWHLFFSIPFIILSILNIWRDNSLTNLFVSLYILTSFGIPLSYSFLRIGALNNFEIQESRISSIFGFLGMLLFNLSDILLFISLFTDWVKNYTILISINIYWLSMYLITISMLRSPQEYVEKGKDYYPLQFTSPPDF